MLSTFPAFLPGNSILANPFPDFEACFPPSNFNEPTSIFTLEEESFVVCSPPLQEPIGSNSGSETSNPTPVSSSGSDDPNPNNNYEKNKNLSDCYNASNLGSTIAERKRRRMISNRESARRSRMRKQKHLENTRNQLNRLKFDKWEVANRLRLTAHQNELLRRENEHLLSESAVLRRRLWDIRLVLLVRQHQQHLNPYAWS